MTALDVHANPSAYEPQAALQFTRTDDPASVAGTFHSRFAQLKKPQLVKKPRRHLRAPDSQRLVASRAVTDRRLVVNNIPVNVVLDHIVGGIPPVVEDLRPEDMPADAPDGVVALLVQPLVPEHLGVVVVHLEGAVVHVAGLVGAHEEGVVVDVVVAAVDVREDGHVLPGAVGLVDVEEVGGHEVEVLQVEVELAGEVLDAEAVVAQLGNSPLSASSSSSSSSSCRATAWTWLTHLMHGGRAGLEPEKFADAGLLVLEVVGELLRLLVFRRLALLLPVY